MKTIDGPSKKKVFKALNLMVLSFIMMIGCIAYHDYFTFESIDVVIGKVATVEYGSANYDIKKLIKEVDGEILSIKQDIDPNILGAQEVILEVRKDNMVKDVPVVIEVVDSIAPVISLRESSITITEGESFNLLENISSVYDAIDGNLSYLENATVNSLKYFNIQYNTDIYSVGDHEIIVNAVDSSGNKSRQTFTLKVNKKPIYYPISYNLPAFAQSNSIVSIAYSLLGRPYVYGSAGPDAFDCSGFVSYVYSCVGKYVSRGTYSLQYEGYGVRYEDMQPGDVILWGYADGQPTHASIYVGNGQMIHAANPSTGVIINDVSLWIYGSGTRILTIRRFQ